MSASAGFLWRFLDDVWDLLPSPDRELFESYWKGFLQIGGQLQNQVIEASLSPIIETVPVFQSARWNRFMMDDSSCDLLQKTEALILLPAPAPLGAPTCLYETLVVTDPAGQVSYSERLEFFDGSIRSLRYGDLVANTVAVKLGPIEYTPGFDYVVNLVAGTIQALDGGRIPIDQVCTVSYAHRAYVRGVDYEVDETRATIWILPLGTLPPGGSVSVSYTYNTTPTVPLQSGSGAVLASLTSLVDLKQDFSGLLPNRKLTVLAGPNAGAYGVTAILGRNEVAVDPPFGVAQVDGGVAYSIDAFPHGVRIPKNVVSIPALQDRIDEPTLVLQEGVDYVIRAGILGSRAAFPLMTLGPKEDRTRALWAEKTLADRETPYRNFGVLIDFYRTNSDTYKQALQGLWYAFWTGSTPENLRRGLQILLGLPYARSAGTVVGLTPPTPTAAGIAQIEDARGQILSYPLPSELGVTIAEGQSVARFEPLTTGVRIFDRNSEPGFVAGRLGRAGIARFLTQKASRGPGADTDETKALKLLEHHLFIPQVLTDALTAQISVKELVTFLGNMKPKWTEFVFSFNADVNETVTLDGAGERLEAETTIDASTTVNNNELNRIEIDGRYFLARATGEIFTGSRASGNFRDLGADFYAFDVDTGDWLRIVGGAYHGYFQVLRRIGANVLSLDLPDTALVPTVGIRYVVLPKGLLLGHDAVNVKREHLKRAGTSYSPPVVLNVKTDAGLDDLTDSEVMALLLVDARNLGNEIQAIVAARVDLGEVQVTAPPTPAPQPHAFSAAAVTRSTGGIVVEAFAI